MAIISLDDINFYQGPSQESRRSRMTTNPNTEAISPLPPLPIDPQADGALVQASKDPNSGFSDVGDIFSSIMGQSVAEHLQLRSSLLPRATPYEGVGEGHPLCEPDTRPRPLVSGVSRHQPLHDTSLDIFTGEQCQSQANNGSPVEDRFIPVERFPLSSDIFSCLDLSKSEEDQNCRESSCAPSLLHLSGIGEIPMLIPDDDDDDSSSNSMTDYSSPPNVPASPSADTLKDGSAYRDTHRTYEVDMAWGTKADGEGSTGSGPSPLDPVAASPLDDIPDMATTATATATTSEHQNPQKLQTAELAKASFCYGCFDDLSEDELHGPSLYPVVQLKRSDTLAKTGYMEQSRIPSPYFLWESRTDCDSSVISAPRPKRKGKSTAVKKRSCGSTRRRC